MMSPNAVGPGPPGVKIGSGRARPPGPWRPTGRNRDGCHDSPRPGGPDPAGLSAFRALPALGVSLVPRGLHDPRAGGRARAPPRLPSRIRRLPEGLLFGLPDGLPRVGARLPGRVV